ncbi:MAG: zinc ribbon domain-containing protein [Polyangiaceae bacterium]|nr:zinc ribbon domain-containing protein [Polyangiaceae bacterium]
MSTEKTYEMLWDCKYCGATRLLGLTHRHCPNCGAPQDATSRYFPPDDERVAVEDHQYAGADLKCPSCGEANGVRSKHCRNCGGPLEGATSVAARADQVHAAGQFAGDSRAAAVTELGGAPRPEPAPASPTPKPGRGWLGWLAGCGCLTAVVGVVALIAVFVFWKREASLQVTGHSWERTITIERLGKATETAWCDSPPTGGRELSRRRQERSTRKVADGEECKTRKKDQGDGTFKETQECQPKYRSEPVLDDRCTYEVMKWSTARTEEARGASLADAPRWPTATITRPGQREGCERTGPRQETYTVRLEEGGSSTEHTCALAESRWASMKVGSRWKARVHKLTGSLDCSALTPAP